MLYLDNYIRKAPAIPASENRINICGQCETVTAAWVRHLSLSRSLKSRCNFVREIPGGGGSPAVIVSILTLGLEVNIRSYKS